MAYTLEQCWHGVPGGTARAALEVAAEVAAGAHPDVTFAKVDTEANQELSGAAGIMSIPTLMAFRDGILVFNQAGALPAAALDDLISQVQALDIDKVRESVAAR